ncbi:tRNA (guanine(6)-N(2))-methyltransferase THUMP3-like [Haliotis cracherodii]|uniref:tRNA (guanine(6)-N(2))-methyltransferase THUMP3-like n=1 Tax=Haliotis cracherodii TaxID=6455 RepID=UPI0039EC85A2
MAAPTENVTDGANENIDMCEIEATVATGFEQIAKEEVEEKFGIIARAARGKVMAKIPVKDVKNCLELGCVDNIRVLMSSWKNFQYPEDKLECMRKLRDLARDVDWDQGLKVWRQVYTFQHPILSTPVSDTVDMGEPYLTSRENLPKKQPKKKGGKSGKKDKFSKKGKDRSQKDEGRKVGSGDAGDPGRPPDLQFISNKGQYVEGQGRHHRGQVIDGQFDDAESDSDKTGSNELCTQSYIFVRTEETVLSSGVSDMTLGNKDRQSKENTMEGKETNNICADGTKVCDPSIESGGGNTKGAGEETVQPSQATSSPEQNLSSNTEEQISLQENSAPPSSPKKPPSESSSPEKPREKLVPHNPLMPSFRVTCNRAGEGHNFDSMCAAANFGGAVQNYFGWNVDMKKFDVEVILNIEWTDVSVCIGLTRGSLHHRNITVFGATTLRPTVACNMLRLCKIQPGDVVCDPMCGSGSIPIQAARGWPEAYHLSGEKFPLAVDRTVQNVAALNKELIADNKRSIAVDAGYWDVTYLPFRESSVDVFITDLPFGKRMGSRYNNLKLYPEALIEMARVCRPGSGRVCLLTQDKKCMIRVIHTLGRYWQRRMTLSINLGGLAAGVYLLNRTLNPVVQGETTPSTTQEDTSACRDFRTAMPSDPRSGPGFTVVRHTFSSLQEANRSPADTETTDAD